MANADNLRHAVDASAAPPKELDLERSLRGHAVVLDFWATWCGPCQAEAPIVNTIAQRYKDRGLVVVGVNTSDEDGLAARFVAEKGLTFPIVYDEGNSDREATTASTSLPTLIVVSKTGKIVAIRTASRATRDARRHRSRRLSPSRALRIGRKNRAPVSSFTPQ